MLQSVAVMSDATFEIAGPEQFAAPCNGVVNAVPPGHRLLVDGQPQAIPATVQVGQMLQAEPIDLALVDARGASSKAVTQVMQQVKREPVYVDHTVRQPKPRTGPPPPDSTVSKRPVHVRLGTLHQAPATPPPSPQKVADQADGAPIPDGVLSDTDILDLAVDLGGGPTEADVEHAKRQQR